MKKLLYGFDKNLEWKRYKEVCNIKLLRKKYLRKECNKVGTYAEWENDIYKNYQEHSIEYLINFSKFLNNEIRKLEPGNIAFGHFLTQMYAILVPIIFNTLFISKLLEILKMKLYEVVLFSLMALVIILLALWIFTKYVMWSLKSNLYKVHMYEDYKIIIDEMIEKKGFNL